MPKPARNVVYIHSHDTGRYVAPYGHALHTPHYQRFAEQGVLFRNAFCANPTCSPSRACLLTGRYAHANGMFGLAHRGGKLDDPSQCLPHYLREHGFRTALAGIQHIHAGDMAHCGYTDDLHQGQEKLQLPDDPDFDKRDGESVCRAELFLQKQSDDTPPFFLDVGFFLTHRTGPEPDPDRPDGPTIAWHNDDASPLGDPRYAAAPPCLPDTPEVRRDYADYAHAVMRLDKHVGRVLDAIDQAGLADDTLVIITTDHGIAFPGMKCRLTKHGTGVLLLMRGPSATNEPGFLGGRVIQGLASHVDVFPTVCEALGLDAPDWLQGTSLTPLLEQDDDTGSVREHVFSEVNYHGSREPMRSVRTSRYNYVRHLEPLPHAARPNIDNSISKTQLHEAGLLDRAVRSEQLFDLYADPQEACNVADDPAYADTLKELRAALDTWMRDTGDPAIHGKIHRPNMRLNRAEDYSPTDATTYIETQP
ncbi:MAG: sulfatase [Planctomycetota bacterium]